MTLHISRTTRPGVVDARTLFGTLVVTAICAMAEAQPVYRVLDLGSLAGESHAFAVSGPATGVLAAGSSTGSDSHFRAVRFDGLTTGAVAGVAGYSESVGFDIDSAGTIIGASYSLGAISPRAFRFDGTTVEELGSFVPRTANSGGSIAGTTMVAIPAFGGMELPRACVWNLGTLTLLPTLGGSSSQAFAIDEFGRVGGSSFNANDVASRPCVWIGATVIDIGTLGGSRGQVMSMLGDTAVGLSETGAGLLHATKWTLSAGGAVLARVDLGSLVVGMSSAARAMNSAGDIVGVSGFHAVLWRSGTIFDLNLLHSAPNWVLESAWDIDDFGRIVGSGALFGMPRAFLLDPLPDCASDFNRDGFSDAIDYDTFIIAWLSGNVVSDVNADGFVDAIDYDLFIAAWVAGC